MSIRYRRVIHARVGHTHDDAGRGDVTAITEAELRRAYRLGPVARPCLCGGVVIADPVDPTDGVREHQATPKHKAWRAWVEA